MTTIEINIDTYNSMLEKIKEEENKNVELNRQIKKLNQIIYDKDENLEIFREANWYDRVFGWKQILNLTKEETKEDEVQ